MLLIAIVVLSLADLAVTLTHLQTIGMAEANPLAAFLIDSTGSSWVLGIYKCLTVAVCVMLLYRARRHVQGEIASWLGLIILVGVSVLWYLYTDAYTDADTNSLETVQIAQTMHGDAWLMLD